MVFLMYHELESPGRPLCQTEPGYVRYILTASDFRSQMELLKRARWKGVSVSEAIGSFANKTVAITFDDGCETDLLHAAPILREFDFGGTFYVTTGFLRKSGYLSHPQLKELARLRIRDRLPFHDPCLPDRSQRQRLASRGGRGQEPVRTDSGHSGSPFLLSRGPLQPQSPRGCSRSGLSNGCDEPDSDKFQNVRPPRLGARGSLALDFYCNFSGTLPRAKLVADASESTNPSSSEEVARQFRLRPPALSDARRPPRVMWGVTGHRLYPESHLSKKNHSLHRQNVPPQWIVDPTVTLMSAPPLSTLHASKCRNEPVLSRCTTRHRVSQPSVISGL